MALPFALFLERFSIDDDAVDPAARMGWSFVLIWSFQKGSRFRGSWDLVSTAMTTLIGDIRSYKNGFYYHSY